MSEKNLDALAIDTIRGLSMDAVQAANSGHPGTPMALAPLGWLLYSDVMRHDPAQPEWAGRDRFILSCGHASMLQYSLMHLSGYEAVTLEQVKNFRQWKSMTPGHPENFVTPGVETTTGPLGQGVATAVGMAMAARHLGKRFSEDLFDNKIWVIASDGDLMEGVAAEAASLAGTLGLGHLNVFWDDNEITIDGRTDLSFTEDVVKRFESYGWHTLSVDDGMDVEALRAAAEAAAAETGKPTFIRVKTVIGFPAPNKQDTSGAHGSPLGEDEIAKTKEIMGWPAEPFHVPEEMAAARQAILDRGKKAREAWEKKRADWKAGGGDDAALTAALSGELPAGWDALPEFPADAKGMATRAASGKVLAALADNVPELVGGSADLAGSNKTQLEAADFRPGQEGVPRYVFWGVREHAMGAAVNGMALFGGVVPFGATFLIFSDYMRPAIRLAALMGLKARHVFSHDSIGLGEDGPTHQPIEQLASLRAIPGVAVFRPADANETRESWKAMMTYDGPAVIALTRQNVPTLDRSTHGDVAGVHKGAYVLKAADGDAQVHLVATGSEVEIALDAQKKLAEGGVKATVVSMPCWELFEAQDAAYQDSVLPRDGKFVVVEAGCRMGWERWVGRDAAFVTLEHFGASAPAETLYEKFGLTADNVAAKAKSLL
ncbi:MAG: transketolase [Deltaproteobacteria bacterium]|nr:transketolase [Deltaproteobacteria bacterium]